jgi:hypothetical protein
MRGLTRLCDFLNLFLRPIYNCDCEVYTYWNEVFERPKVIVQEQFLCDVSFSVVCCVQLLDIRALTKPRSVSATCMNLISSLDNIPHWTDVTGRRTVNSQSD